MIPIVLSAGRGSRVGEETQALPKWFLKIGNKNLCDYQLDVLSTKFDTVYVVLGHGFVNKNNPNDVLPSRNDINIIPVVYSEWENVENAGSALCAYKHICPSEDLLLLCGDIIIDEENFLQFMNKYASFTDDQCSAVAAFEGIQNEKTAVSWDNNKNITDYGDIEGHEEAGMFILNKNHLSDAEDMWSNNLNEWFPIIFPKVRSKAITIDGSKHFEINTTSDLHTARERLTISNEKYNE